MWLPEGVALGFVRAVGTDGVEIERSEENAFTLPSFDDECVPPRGLGQVPEVEDERVIRPDGLVRPEALRPWLHHAGVCLLAWPQLWRAPEFIGSLPGVGGNVTDVP